MNSSGDAAESIVRMSLQGIEVAAKITGSGAKNVSAMIYTIMKDNTKTKGKTTLTNMLKSGKPSKVFSLREDELKKFTDEAKRYGVLYCVLAKKNQKSPDGLVDIMVREEDASKVNRIVERFKLSTTNKAEVESIYEKAKIDKALREAKEKGTEIRTIEDKMVDDILNKPIQKEENEVKNPQLKESEKNPQSELSYGNKKEGVEVQKKPSVREMLKDIKNELKNRTAPKEIQKDLKKGKSITLIDLDKKKSTKYTPTKKDIKKSSKGKER